MTLGEVLRATADYLERKGVDSPRLDAELLLARALGMTRIELYTQHDKPLTDEERGAARALVERRGRREPLAYVLGDAGFRHLVLTTDARALVPRPETEIVVDRCLALLEGVPEPRVLDVGTGTGAIALSLKDERPDADVTATDVSAEALSLARENADRLGLEVDFMNTSITADLDGRWDLVVSNPPYVEAEEYPSVPAELAYEPREALVDTGQTDMLVRDVPRVLRGWLVLECHEERAHDVAALMRAREYSDVRVTDDLAGRPRVVEGRWTT